MKKLAPGQRFIVHGLKCDERALTEIEIPLTGLRSANHNPEDCRAVDHAECPQHPVRPSQYAPGVEPQPHQHDADCDCPAEEDYSDDRVDATAEALRTRGTPQFTPEEQIELSRIRALAGYEPYESVFQPRNCSTCGVRSGYHAVGCPDAPTPSAEARLSNSRRLKTDE